MQPEPPASSEAPAHGSSSPFTGGCSPGYRGPFCKPGTVLLCRGAQQRSIPCMHELGGDACTDRKLPGAMMPGWNTSHMIGCHHLACDESFHPQIIYNGVKRDVLGLSSQVLLILMPFRCNHQILRAKLSIGQLKTRQSAQESPQEGPRPGRASYPGARTVAGPRL